MRTEGHLMNIPAKLLSSFVLMVGACATPSTNYPRISAADIAAQTPAIQAGVVDAVLERQHMWTALHGLYWLQMQTFAMSANVRVSG